MNRIEYQVILNVVFSTTAQVILSGRFGLSLSGQVHLHPSHERSSVPVLYRKSL